jgi:hypothetical protein
MPHVMPRRSPHFAQKRRSPRFVWSQAGQRIVVILSDA